MLLSLLDGCVLPADMVAAPEGDDALASLQRLSLVELSRLAAVQDAAQPVGEWWQHAPRTSTLFNGCIALVQACV
jgi:hypothetical protein